MIEKVLNRKNLYKAYRQVVRNKGSAGVDGMKVTELLSFLESNRDRIATSILNHSYVPNSIKGIEIPKSNGKTRLLGVPTVVDRWLQQALSQVLMTKYELMFERHSYGFRPEKNIHKAVTQALKNINDGYQDIVDIDLKGFFDEVDHSGLLQLIYQRVKCPTTLRLIRKWLRAPIQINGKLHRRREGVPQGSPISPLLSNILLDLLDKELERRNLKYVRYADDFSIYTKSKKEARKVGNEIYLFLKEKLGLPINRDAQARECVGGALSVVASEDHPILKCWGMHLFQRTKKESKENISGGEEKQLGLTEAQAQADHQKDQTLQLRGKTQEAGRGLARMDK